MKRVTKMDGGGCTTLYMYSMPLNYVLQMVKMVNFRFCVFYHNFFKWKKKEREWTGVYQGKNVRQVIQVEGTACTEVIRMDYNSSFRELQIGGIARKFSSVQFSRSAVSGSLQLLGLQHARPPCPSPNPGDDSNSCPLSRWCWGS